MYIEDLLERLKDYSPDDKALIIRAFEFAKCYHEGQFRKSGEPYIIHPIAVACILAEMHADSYTIAAGLLHDTIEDTKATKEDIEKNFNSVIANLVDGVTKIKKEESSNPEIIKDENIYKILKSITLDVRIFIIKLADRLHNMRTMEYQSPEKQKSKSRETLNLYVPIADYLGEYHFKLELEDLAFKYLNPSSYEEIKEHLSKVKDDKRDIIDQIIAEVSQMLNSNEVDYNLKLNVKSIYEVYKRLKVYGDYDLIHDLLMIKILLRSQKECYRARDLLKGFYKVVDSKSKDYIKYPKSNRYMGLHTSVILPDDTRLQFQFKTPKMYDINAYGITEYWRQLKDGKAANAMQDEVKKMPFYNELDSIINNSSSPTDFRKKVNDDILTRKTSIIYNNHRIDLKVGSKISDLIKLLNINIFDIDSIKINGCEIYQNYMLTNNNIVEIKLKKKDITRIRK